jgi:hypothetical protein
MSIEVEERWRKQVANRECQDWWLVVLKTIKRIERVNKEGIKGVQRKETRQELTGICASLGFIQCSCYTAYASNSFHFLQFLGMQICKDSGMLCAKCKLQEDLTERKKRK